MSMGSLPLGDMHGIGWVLLASATSGFSGYKACLLLLCQGAPVAQLVRASDWYSEGPGFNPQLGPGFFFFLYSLRKLIILKSLQCMYPRLLDW